MKMRAVLLIWPKQIHVATKNINYVHSILYNYYVNEYQLSQFVSFDVNFFPINTIKW